MSERQAIGLTSCVFLLIGFVLLVLIAPSPSFAQEPQNGCLSCHAGIEPIRVEGSAMLAAIQAMGQGVGDAQGCTVCHGGNPQASSIEDAHQGAPDKIGPETFYPDPGSIWIADKTCGQCHPDKPYALMRTLMQTEAGKIQGNMFTWTVQEDYTVVWGNYDLEDPDGIEPRVGSDAYKALMQEMVARHQGQFPSSLEQLPNPSAEDILNNPFMAGFTYQRQQCQRCHVGIRGRQKRGDYRGMGCSSCHIPYSNEGFYQGNDPTVPQDEPGHLLLHQIQGTRKANNGIPTETCNSCHNRGKRIGVTFQGLMEFPYGSPFNAQGEAQPPLHTKKYLFIKDDLHHQEESRPENPEGRMLCQDCHTSVDIHGDGNIFGTTLAQVEIECTDCHGTPDMFPWELPLSYMEEFGRDLPAEPRGTSDQLLTFQSFATVYDSQVGYLLTARGNPFGNVVRVGDDVMLHSATGIDFTVPLLKTIKIKDTWKSQSAQVAMESVSTHMDSLECYACHSDWAPQCYGCHVKTDYSGGKEATDWVQIGSTRFSDGLTIAEHPEQDEAAVTSPGVVFGTSPGESPGEVNESRSYLRWEEPILGINGEGRVTPLMPGCQVVKTVIGPDGQVLLQNAIGKTSPGTEGAVEGQRAIDMAPVQPHTSTRNARICESCHSDPKALGYGIQDGRYQQRYTEDIIVDLELADGSIWPQETQVQIPAIPELPIDWSQIVTRTGQQLQIVGSHWPDSRPLDQIQRERMERTGACMGCHQNMADTTFWTEEVIAKYGRILSDDEHIEHMNEILQEAVAGDLIAVRRAEQEVETARADVEAAEAEVAAAEEALSQTRGNSVLFVTLVVLVAILTVAITLAFRRTA
jgi:hypothetical protein